MNRAEFMARAIIALAKAEARWTEHDGYGNKTERYAWIEPKDCAERADKLWTAYSEAMKAVDGEFK